MAKKWHQPHERAAHLADTASSRISCQLQNLQRSRLVAKSRTSSAFTRSAEKRWCFPSREEPNPGLDRTQPGLPLKRAGRTIPMITSATAPQHSSPRSMSAGPSSANVWHAIGASSSVSENNRPRDARTSRSASDPRQLATHKTPREALVARHKRSHCTSRRHPVLAQPRRALFAEITPSASGEEPSTRHQLKPRYMISIEQNPKPFNTASANHPQTPRAKKASPSQTRMQMNELE